MTGPTNIDEELFEIATQLKDVMQRIPYPPPADALLITQQIINAWGEIAMATHLLYIGQLDQTSLSNSIDKATTVILEFNQRYPKPS